MPPADASRRRCAIYTRKSSEEGLDQEFNSLAAQREACEAYIRSQRNEGWVLARTRYDDGRFSGGNLERPALQCLLADIRGEGDGRLGGTEVGHDGKDKVRPHHGSLLTLRWREMDSNPRSPVWETTLTRLPCLTATAFSVPSRPPPHPIWNSTHGQVPHRGRPIAGRQ
jgi:Resolvase, N terminal domain